jgi:hypothetical protein
MYHDEGDNQKWCNSVDGIDLNDVQPYLSLGSVQKFSAQRLVVERLNNEPKDRKCFSAIEVSISGRFDSNSMKCFLQRFHSLEKLKSVQGEDPFRQRLLYPFAIREGLSHLKRLSNLWNS